MLHPHFLHDIGCHIRRYRKTCGYGIHSPRLFYLLREVILQRAAYYAYAPLAGQHRLAARSNRRLCLKRKECELLFRLANDLQTEEAVLLGCPTGIEGRYMQAARVRICLRESLPPQPEAGGELSGCAPARLFVVNARNPEVSLVPTVAQALARLGEGDALYVALPAGRKGVGKAEREWLAHPHTGVAFDLYVGFLLLGEPGNFRQHLIRINF